LKINGIFEGIINVLVERGNTLGQGRSVGTIGFVDSNNCISAYSEIVDGGLSGLPYRKLLSRLVKRKNISLLELINQLPDNAVLISTEPGQTGIIVGTGGINIFNLPIVRIGVKNKKLVGVGVLYPEKDFFRLATQSEKAELDSLMALNMEDEREALRLSTEIKLKFLRISEELPIVKGNINDIPAKISNDIWEIPEYRVKRISRDFAEDLVAKSNSIEQGREVAALGIINDDGVIEQAGEIVIGGMGYVPSRLLASSYCDIDDISLREAYTNIIPKSTVIVHTHPGGTGVMHINDAMAGPGTWGRPIIAIGHNENGEIKGATVIEKSSKLFGLADENEILEGKFFRAETPEEELKIRKRRYGLAQEFTDLCNEIII